MEINPDQLLEKIREAKDGSQSAFNYLLDKYWNDVYGFQLKKTRDEYESEDITIQTFSKAFNKIESFDENYSFTTWLIAISKNIHIDQVRKKMLPLGHALLWMRNGYMKLQMKRPA